MRRREMVFKSFTSIQASKGKKKIFFWKGKEVLKKKKRRDIARITIVICSLHR